MRFLAPSAFAGHAALSGAAGIRTLPLRRCFRPSVPSTRQVVGGRLPDIRPCGFPPLRRPEFHVGRSSGRLSLASGHASPVTSADVPLPYLANCVAWPGLRGPAALLGFNPSQCCSCPQADQAFPPVFGPTCRSPAPPPRSFFSRDQPSIFTSLVLWHFGRPVTAARIRLLGLT